MSGLWFRTQDTMREDSGRRDGGGRYKRRCNRTMLCHWSKALVFPLLDEGREAKKTNRRRTIRGETTRRRKTNGQTSTVSTETQQTVWTRDGGMEMMEGWRDGGMEAQVDVELDTNQWRRLLEEVENKRWKQRRNDEFKKAQNCKNF